jgi:hypothetical protein
MKCYCWPLLAGYQDGKEHLLSSSTSQHLQLPLYSDLFSQTSAKGHLLWTLADVVVGMASLAEASAILLAFGADVEGAVWRIGASGLGGIMAGDDLSFKGTFWPANIFCLYINFRLER